MNPYVARAVGAVAVVLGIVAIWVEFAPGGTTYWDSEGHSEGIAILVLAILAGIGIVLASLTQLRVLDHLWPLPGLILGGIALFVPLAALGNGNLGEMKVGGWLGVASCGLFLLGGVLTALPVAAATPRTAAAPMTLPAAATASTAAAPATPPEPEPEPAPAAQSDSPAADWYPDPKGEARLRYWDGTAWTDNTAD
jgi:uncharacterized protein DUF2510